jgi:hypothetical protein
MGGDAKMGNDKMSSDKMMKKSDGMMEKK